MLEKDESMEIEYVDKICVMCGGDCENVFVMKVLMDVIGEFVIVDNYVVFIFFFDIWMKIILNESKNRGYRLWD